MRKVSNRVAVVVVSAAFGLGLLAQPRGALMAQPIAGPASSAPVTDAARKEAAERFKRGVKLQEEGQLEAAIIEFERAYQLAPNYRVLYNVGIVYRDRADRASALGAFERYLKDGANEIDAKRKKEVETEISKLRDVLAQLTITSNVAGAEVTLDDLPIGVTPIKDRYVNVGRHKIVVTKEGYQTFSSIQTFAARDTPTIKAELKEIPKAPPPPSATAAPPPPPTSSASSSAPPPPPTDTGDPGAGQRVLGFTLAGVGAAGVIVGGVFGLMASSKWGDVKSVCVDKGSGRKCPTKDDQTKAESAKTFANVSTIGFALGGTALVVGTVFVLTAPSRDTGSIQIVPSVGTGGGGVLVNGSF